MKKTVILAVALLLPVVPAFAVGTTDNGTERAVAGGACVGVDPATLSTSAVPAADEEIAPLQAQARACLDRGDYAGAKVFENQVQSIIYRRQPQPPVDLTVSEAPPPSGLDAGPDVPIVSGATNAFAADYETDGTMYAAAAQPDSTIRVYKSTNHGTSWAYLCGATISPKARYTELGMVVGIGDSNFIHVMCVHPNGNGDVYQLRWNHDGTGVQLFGVWVGPDTITDFSFARDNISPYYMYACVNEPLHAVGEQNTWMLRSTGFGKDWAVTDSFYNGLVPSVQTGAGSWVYLSLLPQVPQGKGQINLLWNKTYGTGTWDERNPKPDTFLIETAVFTPAFTTPESLAVAWVAYHHLGTTTGTSYDLLAMHSTDGCKTWNSGSPTRVSASKDMEIWPDMKNYRSVGNTYVNLSFIKNEAVSITKRRVYRAWASAAAPTAWHGYLLMSDSQPFRAANAIPQLVYSPGASWTGAGVVYQRYSTQYLVWAPPAGAAQVSADSLYFKAYQGTALMSSAKGASPAPVNRTAMAFQYDQSTPCMDPDGNYVYELFGNRLRQYNVANGSHVEHITADSVGRWACATDGEYIYSMSANKIDKYTATGSFINSTTLDLSTVNQFCISLVNDTLWVKEQLDDQVWHGYAAAKLNGGSISQDATWDAGGGTYRSVNIAFDGTYYYVARGGNPNLTFRRFRVNRTLYDEGTLTIDPRGVMCRRNPPVGAAEPRTPAELLGLAVRPNPFRRAATVVFSLPMAGQASLKLYDVGGRLVATLASGMMAAGSHRVNVERGGLLVSGVYLLRLEAAGTKTTRKLVLE